jgi:hypothetical protein
MNHGHRMEDSRSFQYVCCVSYTLSLLTVQFELNTTSASPGAAYLTVDQITITLSSTCVAPEVTYGGGTCFSNLSPSTWSLSRVLQFAQSGSSTLLSNLAEEIPEISTGIVFSLLAAALSFTALIMILMLMSCGDKARGTNKRARLRRHIGCLGTSWFHALLGVIGFILLLVGAILLHVQVNHTLSALQSASMDGKYSDLLRPNDGLEQNTSGTFWGMLWAAVALLAVSPIMLVADGLTAR